MKSSLGVIIQAGGQQTEEIVSHSVPHEEDVGPTGRTGNYQYSLPYFTHGNGNSIYKGTVQ